MSILFDSYFPFDQGPGAIASDVNWRKMSRYLFPTSGVLANSPLGQLTPSLAAGIITIQPGSVWLDGYYAESTAPKTFTASANMLLVAQLNRPSHTITFVPRVGVGLTPQNTIDGDIFEIPLASMAGGILTDARVLVRNVSNLDLVPTSGLIQKVTQLFIPSGTFIYTNTTYDAFYSSVPITKKFSGTRLVVNFTTSGFLATGSPVGNVHIGFSLNGGTVGSFPDAMSYFFNAVNDHRSFSGGFDFSGLPVGTYNIRPGKRVDSGMSFSVDLNDRFWIVIDEVF